MQQMGGGTLTLSILFVPVSLLKTCYFSHVSSVDAKHHEASLVPSPPRFCSLICVLHSTQKWKNALLLY